MLSLGCLRSFTRITYLNKSIGILSLAALPQLQLVWGFLVNWCSNSGQKKAPLKRGFHQIGHATEEQRQRAAFRDGVLSVFMYTANLSIVHGFSRQIVAHYTRSKSGCKRHRALFLLPF